MHTYTYNVFSIFNGCPGGDTKTVPAVTKGSAQQEAAPASTSAPLPTRVRPTVAHEQSSALPSQSLPQTSNKLPSQQGERTPSQAQAKCFTCGQLLPSRQGQGQEITARQGSNLRDSSFKSQPARGTRRVRSGPGAKGAARGEARTHVRVPFRRCEGNAGGVRGGTTSR